MRALFNELALLPGVELGLRALNGQKISVGMACRCCGDMRVELVLDLGNQPHCNRLVLPQEPDPPSYPLRLAFCHNCSMVQIDYTIPKEEMFSNYPYVSGTTDTLKRHFKATTRRLADTYGLHHGHVVVDIGSNDGTWLQCWHDETDVSVLGIEPDHALAGQANARGLLTWNDFFDEEIAEQIVASIGQPKLVTAAGVFFHMEDLHSACRGIERMLADDGVLVVQCIYLGGMVQNTAFDQIYHEHLVYYTLTSLQNLLRRHGLAVFDVKHLKVHGGTLEAHICRAGTYQPTMAVISLLEEERQKGLDRVWAYHRFADNVRSIKTALLATLQQYRDCGKSVWAYGAPAKGATLLNSLGITKELIPLAVEKNPLKMGKLMPGSRIPIIEEGRGRPDAYLLLAWNYLDEFMAKEREFLGNGGRFIVPIPHVRELPA